MNVHQKSTNKSTSYEKQIIQLENELSLAESAGAKNETIQAIKGRLKKLTTKSQNEKDWRDIRKVKKWPDKILIQRYEETVEYANNLGDQLNSLSLLSNHQLTKEAKKYQQTIEIIEILEDEGRGRELAYFLSEGEIESIFNNTDSPSPTRVTNSERKKQ